MDHLASGVSRLHAWYQIACLALVLFLIWYNEEVSAAVPPYLGFVEVFVDPVFDALSIDMYLSADYREIFEGLMLRHKMLMIARTVILGCVFVLLRRWSRGEEQAIKKVTDSTAMRYILLLVDIAESLSVLQSFSTKRLMLDMKPDLTRSLTDNLAWPAIKWSKLISTWWVYHVIPSLLLALAVRVVLSSVKRRNGGAENGCKDFRAFIVTFQVFRLVIVAAWWQADPENSFVVTSVNTFIVLIMKLLILHVTVNLQNQLDDGTDPLSTDEQQQPTPTSSLTSFFTYCKQSKLLLIHPLTIMTGCSIVLLSANMFALLVVILVMYLSLVWFPAAIIVISIDFFINASGLAAMSWLLEYSTGWREADNLRIAFFMFCVLVLVMTVTAYLWALAGPVGITAEMIVASAIYMHLLYSEEGKEVYPSDHLVTSAAALVVVIFLLSLVSSSTPSFPSLIRRYTQSLARSTTLGCVVALSYTVPSFLPTGTHTPLVLLLFLVQLGVVKEYEATLRGFIDKALFNIVQDAGEESW